MIPVAVSRELLVVTLGTRTLRSRVKISLPSNILSKNTGMVTELVVFPGSNVADLGVESKSLPATQ